MNAPAIKVEGLGKRYRLGRWEPYHSLRETLTKAATAPWRWGSGRKEPETEPRLLWALKEVRFEIQPGEVVGIIGRNGAGKSTLLKILSRITDPTEGTAEVRGRVRALLEIGTGFHPELTGRENIFLNGAILGMTRREIRSKFGEIADFSEVGKFLDTPVKHYSSGMYVRLAFSVAAHLEPEILLIDEVLAVGDASFQKKCLGKMGDVARQGRTVLFVSHNLGAVCRLCPRILLFDQGRLAQSGEARIVVDRYLSLSFPSASEIEYPADPSKPAQFLRIRILDHLGRPGSELDTQHPFTVEMDVEAHELRRAVRTSLCLETRDGVPVFVSYLSDSQSEDLTLQPGIRYRFTVKCPGGLLNAGGYRIRAGLYVPPDLTLDYPEGMSFELRDFGSSLATGFHRSRDGLLLLPLPWTSDTVGSSADLMPSAERKTT